MVVVIAVACGRRRARETSFERSLMRPSMRGPALQRLAPLRHQFGALIDAGDAAINAADVIEHLLDNLMADAECLHATGAASSQIVNAPRRDGAAFPVCEQLHLGIECDLHAGEILGGRCGVAKHQIMLAFGRPVSEADRQEFKASCGNGTLCA